jgi:hypothetical protein
MLVAAAAQAALMRAGYRLKSYLEEVLAAEQPAEQIGQLSVAAVQYTTACN